MRVRTRVSPFPALVVSAGLSFLFLLVYGGCLWITARRQDVGVLYFEWERRFPFVPFMILPYLSIDLFFIAAPFLFPNEQELKVYAARVASAIVIAGLFFLLLPLRFAFPPPEADGWIGRIFDAFRALDAPHNLFPSLHATLLVFLAVAYARNLCGFARAAVLVWFVLIAWSPLLTRQHHVVDILGGFALAGLCFLGIRQKI